ncbi:MAG TPA: sugar phosphate nucleotidyltransferase [Myxococcota bacterium]|nr:sugar phosphate nucleotidyltransferase [Myxococcota bacterium]HRY94068.1 sugar phosphate nucleotidyltransferase [Myxococcota bacterium]
MRLEAGFDWRVPLVVLGAGRARRLGRLAAGRSKVALRLREDRPERLLDVLVEAWAPWASELWLVVRSEDEELARLLAEQPIPGRLVLQPEPRGTAAAVAAMAAELPARFLVVLGDCLVAGRMAGPASPFAGLAVWPGAARNAVRANYAVRLAGERVLAVEEKPAEPGPEQVCGLGVYFFDRALLEAMCELPPDRQGRREITDGLAFALGSGVALWATRLHGRYVNVNNPDDLRQAGGWFLQP